MRGLLLVILGLAACGEDATLSLDGGTDAATDPAIDAAIDAADSPVRLADSRTSGPLSIQPQQPADITRLFK